LPAVQNVNVSNKAKTGSWNKINNSVSGLGSDMTVKTDDACVVLLVKNGNRWNLSVSDPTNGSISTTKVYINGVAHDVTFPTGDDKGKTVTLDIE